MRRERLKTVEKTPRRSWDGAETFLNDIDQLMPQPSLHGSFTTMSHPYLHITVRVETAGSALKWQDYLVLDGKFLNGECKV